jgi:hypothetical protein
MPLEDNGFRLSKKDKRMIKEIEGALKLEDPDLVEKFEKPSLRDRIRKPWLENYFSVWIEKHPAMAVISGMLIFLGFIVVMIAS